METSSLSTYFSIIRRRFWVILLLLAVTLGVILTRSWTTPTTYHSSIVLQVLPLEAEEVPLFSRPSQTPAEDAVNLIMYQFTNVLKTPRIVTRALQATGIDMTAGEVIESLRADRDASGDNLTVTVTARQAADAPRLAEAIVDEALKEYRGFRVRTTAVTGEFLQKQLDEVDRSLETAKTELLRFKLDNSLEFIDREVQLEQDAVRRSSADQETAENEAARLTAMADEQAKQARELRAGAEKLPADRIERPGSLERAAALETASRELLVQAAGQRSVATNTGSQLSRHQTNLTSLIVLLSDYQKLEQTVKERQDERTFLNEKIREAELKQSQAESYGYYQVVTSASMPQAQKSIQTTQVLVLGGGLAVVAGLILIFAIEFALRALRPAAPPRQQRVES